uniref:Uncharacterized protein n=1 Tax=Plectus sambesii TaxID=2011161 RepID=A0A914XRQ3_9BILA
PLFQRINEVHLRLGLVYKALEDFDLALKHLNCVFIDCSPCTLNKLEIRFHIAHCYDSRGDLQRAYHEYNVLLHDLQSHSSFNLVKASVFRQLAWLCYRTECEGESRLQKLNEAVANLHESLKYDPNSGKTYYYLGRCYGAIPGRAHDAFVNYRQSIDKSEADADTWCSIGVLYQQQNQPMDALQAYICAVQLDGHHSAAWTDLGWLYEVHQQFDDALQCFKKAVKYKPAAPEALKARIQLLEKELKSAPPLSTPKQPPVRQPLPSLEKAWKLPIPAELTQRQDDFLRHKYQRYKDGSGALWTMGILNTELEAAGQEKPSYYLSQTQMQMMQILQQNQQRLDADQMSVLQQLQHKYSLMQQDLRRSDMQRRMQPNVQPHKMITASQLGQATPQHGELPLVSQDDIMNILGGPPPQPAKEAIKRHSSTTEDDILLGGLGDTGESSGKHDPMLSSAALTSKDASRDGSQPDSMSSAHASRLQEERVSSTSDVPEMSMSTPIKSEVGCPPPPALSLLSKVNLALNCTASELLQACAKRAEGSANGFQIFDERVRPPSPPPPPKEHIPKDKLLRPTPLVLIDARKDATAPELQQFCYNSPIALIRGLTSTLKMDLSLFSTKSLMETAPEHDVEVRT